MTVAALTQSPPSHQPEPGRSQGRVSAQTGGPGAAEPAERPDAPWVSPAPTQAPQFRNPDDPVLPVRAVEGAWGYECVSAIIDARDRTLAMIASNRAAWFVDRLNRRGA